MAPAIVVCLLVALSSGGCRRRPTPAPVPKSVAPPVIVQEHGEAAKLPNATAASTVRPVEVRMVNAAWYDVPADSLAKRRAGLEELTAAHNHLPIGTLVRVTRMTNGKSVVVRITDRGIHTSHVKIDLCKEAAEQLEMVRDGIARVRMEVLPPDAENVKSSQSAAP